jgi:hypothetical protein
MPYLYGVMATHIKHAMTRKIEWVVCRRCSLRSCTCAPARPSRMQRAPLCLPFPPQTSRALASKCARPLVQLSPIVGESVLRALGGNCTTFAPRKRALVKQAPPPPPVRSCLALALAGGMLEARHGGRAKGGVGGEEGMEVRHVEARGIHGGGAPRSI